MAAHQGRHRRGTRRWTPGLAAASVVAIIAVLGSGGTTAAMGTADIVYTQLGPACASDYTADCHSVWVTNAQGSRSLRVTTGGAPVWSPDRSKIAFSSTRSDVELARGLDDSDNSVDIFVVNSDGSHLRQLTSSPLNEYQPAWSPDGRQIAYVCRSADPWQPPYLCVMDARGTTFGQRDLRLEGRDADWSPDGRSIAYIYDCCGKQDGPSGLYVTQVDGTNNRLVIQTNPAGPLLYNLRSPDWSPDGRRIAISAVTQRGSGHSDILTLTSAGNSLRDLTRKNGRDESDPSWSPDGLRIAFTRGAGTKSDIFQMSSTGHARTRLTNTPGEASSYAPDWGQARSWLDRRVFGG